MSQLHRGGCAHRLRIKLQGGGGRADVVITDQTSTDLARQTQQRSTDRNTDAVLVTLILFTQGGCFTQTNVRSLVKQDAEAGLNTARERLI